MDEKNSERASMLEGKEEVGRDETQPVKRRKTGWDRDQRVPVTSHEPTSSFHAPNVNVPNSSVQALQTAQEIASKLALQQQLLARTSLANYVTKPGCRIYVG